MAAIDVTQLVVLAVTSRDPDPAVIDDPTGGGGMPDSTDPPAGVDLCGAETIVGFVDVTPVDGTRLRYTKVPINVTEADDPIVQTFGAPKRLLTSRQGELRGTSFSMTLFDRDRALRELEKTDGLVNALVEHYLSTEPAIKAAATPRRVFSGLVSDSEPVSPLSMRLEVSDYLQNLLDVVPPQQFPSRRFSVADFPNLANDPDSASSPGNPDLINKPVPIGYGALSDEDQGPAAMGVAPAPYVGRRLVDGFMWDEYAVFGHAPAQGGILGCFGDNGAGLRGRMVTSREGVDFLWPGHAGWNAAVGSSALYRDFNGRRYTVFYSRGPTSDSARLGTVPFTVNIGGCEDVGDGTGDMFDELPIQFFHLLNNWIVQSYQSGSWLPYPVVRTVSPYDRFKSATFVAAAARNAARLTGGYKGAFIVGNDGETWTAADVALKAYEHGLYLGSNKDGQIIGSAITPAASSVRSISDITDRVEQSISMRRRRDEIRNRVLYRYPRRYWQVVLPPQPIQQLVTEFFTVGVDGVVDGSFINYVTSQPATQLPNTHYPNVVSFPSSISASGPVAYDAADGTFIWTWRPAQHLLRYDTAYNGTVNEPPNGDTFACTYTAVPAPFKADADDYVQVDSPSITKYGERTMEIDMLTRDEATADDIAALHLEVLARGPLVPLFRDNVCGTNVELGDRVNLTDAQGLDASGWTDQPLRVEALMVDVDTPSVELECLDLSGLP